MGHLEFNLVHIVAPKFLFRLQTNQANTIEVIDFYQQR